MSHFYSDLKRAQQYCYIPYISHSLHFTKGVRSAFLCQSGSDATQNTVHRSQGWPQTWTQPGHISIVQKPRLISPRGSRAVLGLRCSQG